MEYSFGYIISLGFRDRTGSEHIFLRSPFTPSSIYLRGTIYSSVAPMKGVGSAGRLATQKGSVYIAPHVIHLEFRG